MRIQPYQRLNHFPSMHLICRKVCCLGWLFPRGETPDPIFVLPFSSRLPFLVLCIIALFFRQKNDGLLLLLFHFSFSCNAEGDAISTHKEEPSAHARPPQVALCNTMYRARGVAEAQFRFYPRTWALPGQLSDFRIYYSGLQQKKTFIIKPSAGCQGVHASWTSVRDVALGDA